MNAPDKDSTGFERRLAVLAPRRDRAGPRPHAF